MTDSERQAPSAREWACALLLILLGVGARLTFVSRFPTLPFSDFQALIEFGLRLSDQGLVEKSWHWQQFNPGLPLILSVLFRFLPGEPVSVARTATAVVTGLLPLLPFLLWRGVVSFRWRMAAGLLLALWPGQIFFSGVVAQDNWVLLPTIALAALAARNLLMPDDRGHPIAAGLLFTLAIAIRQEMLIVLLPVVVVASGALRRVTGRRKRVSLLALAAGLPILALCAQRAAATGHLTITTEHGGLGLLGSAVPGAAMAGWTNPSLYVISIDPDLVTNSERLRKESYRLAWSELKRRYRFHAFRIGVAALRLVINSDADDLFWSLGAKEALDPALRERGAVLAQRLSPWLRRELALIQGLFLAALIVGFRRKNRAILVVAAAVLLKFAIQALISPMGRLIVPAVALELLAISLAAAEIEARSSRRELVGLGALAFSGSIVLLLAVPPLSRLLARKDEPPPVVTRFPLAIAGEGWTSCRIDSGILAAFEASRATIAIRNPDPSPGDFARAVCSIPRLTAGETIVLRLEDSYERGGLPDRIVERVEMQGREVFRHDIAKDPGAGWMEIPLPMPGGDAAREVSIEVLAVSPDPGWEWGRVAAASFEFVRRAP